MAKAKDIKETTPDETKELVALKIKYKTPDSLITRFASNMTVQFIEDEFRVSFFELKPEVYLGSGEPPAEIDAECVSSVIITKSRMQKFINALQQQFDKVSQTNR
jgi:hypothetical protein